jgi:hypothetical protein
MAAFNGSQDESDRMENQSYQGCPKACFSQVLFFCEEEREVEKCREDIEDECYQE